VCVDCREASRTVYSIMSSSNGNGSTKRSVLVVTAGDTREGTGILCNDPMGLCIASEGASVVMSCSNTTVDEAAAAVHAGVFTSMVRLASQLQGGNSSASSAQQQPLITIETDDASILVKSYDGYTVALKVPAPALVSGSSSTPANGTPRKTTSGQSSASLSESAEVTDSGELSLSS
jgi:Ragulator complex protein LAMTOR5